jgi:raffinose/stachyose/melibiose transport system substrate-binding protein
MRRVFSMVAALFVVAATGGFANGQNENAASGSKSSAGGPINLSMYEYVDVTSADYSTFKDVLSQFNAKYPNIKFTIQSLFNEPYHQKLQAMVAGNQIPDVMFLWPSQRTGYVTDRGLAKDLNPYLGDKKADFQPSAVAAQGPNGQLWELPFKASTATTVVWTNDALLKKLGLTYPKTLADLIDQSAKIRAAGLVPIAMADKEGWETESCLLSTLVGRLGGNSWLQNANAQKNGAKFTDPQFVDALKIVKQMSDAKLFSPGIVTNDYNTAIQTFEQQKAVYLIDGDWRDTQLEKDLTPDQQQSISLHTFPAIPGETVHDTISNIPATGYGMSSALSGAKAQAAWDWIYYYAGPEGSAIRITHGEIPSYQKLDTSSYNLGIVVKKLIQYYKDVPGTNTVLDGIMAPKPIGVLNPDLQLLMLDQKTPEQVAQEVQTWYTDNPNG